MSSDPRQALDRLRKAAASGTLEELCRRYRVRLLVVFGSAVISEGIPTDLDVAVAFEHGVDGDLLGLITELSDVARDQRVDLMDLRRAGPVARERALVGCLPLFESERGAFARAQMAAILERLDTSWLRSLDLDLMAG